MRFSLSHILAPRQSPAEFFAMARALGVTDVEIRNDTPNVVGTLAPADVKAAAATAGVNLLSINALYPFNVWNDERRAQTEKLADYAAASGAKALVMCPLNDGTPVSQADVVTALKAIKPILESRGITGLVEPLGFPVSSLRRKADAIAAIKEAGGEGLFKLVHDTFHHHLASETEFFPEWTGLVHISGVVDADVSVDKMLDAHRVLVDKRDRLGNIPQIRALQAAGYKGPFSFEPFATEVQELADPQAALADSIGWIREQVAA
ncbi:MAG: xylose isomerase [Curvibacter sp. RIFCSPHIGHO2_12_FULL_63_18]|nr:MAG: xylose isomerase [Curvibacter sp. GWA2_63_95]OGP04583.1 MAG: xylose isomerase [Curvibacter sp. RIFCSPHIGHO2_12_FULL_63_18]HCX80931.1 xylose isomerase [Rhodoferax sp.]